MHLKAPMQIELDPRLEGSSVVEKALRQPGHTFKNNSRKK